MRMHTLNTLSAVKYSMHLCCIAHRVAAIKAYKTYTYSISSNLLYNYIINNIKNIVILIWNNITIIAYTYLLYKTTVYIFDLYIGGSDHLKWSISLPFLINCNICMYRNKIFKNEHVYTISNALENYHGYLYDTINA